MSLTLITGPANAAKAGAVLERLREALERAGSARLPAPEPLLVVPTSADVEAYQRELAGAGVVFGGEVTTFDGLLRLVAARAGYRGRVLGRVARGRVMAAVVAEADLRVLAGSAATPGFAQAAERLFAELQHALVGPERFTAAMRRWAAERAPARRAYAQEVAGLYAAYRRRLDALGRVDADGHAWGALDALRADPSRWGRRPVFLYGFDDLTPAQLDAVETLVRACGAPVTLSLTYEPGRAAFADRAATVQTLRPLAAEVMELPERADGGDGREAPPRGRSPHAPAARPALHWLERRLFEAPPEAERVSPNGAVRLLEAGGERAEAELVGAALLELVEQGAQPGELAVLLGAPEQAPLLAQVLEAYGLPVERVERPTLARTRLGAGVLAFGRAALPDGTAADVLTWLRTPGKLGESDRVDALERAVRRTGARSAREAERLWGGPLPGLDALRGAAARAPSDALDVLLAELEAVWTARHRRRADVLDAESHADARVAAQARKAVGELRSLAAAEPGLVGGLADVLATLADVEVSLGTGAGAGVLLADPLAVRARRFRAVVVCGLQDGAFPTIARSEPFLDDADRRSLAQATGVVLPLHEDALPAERYRFYAAVSRAQEVLLLAFRSSDEEGEPQLRSPFVDDVRDCFTDELWTARGRRLLAEVTWPPAQAPTPLELRRARAASLGRSGPEEPAPAADGPPIRSPALAARQAARETTAAGDLETFSACGVRWLVERVLRPARIDPDPEPLARGSLAHHVLERTLTLLRERTGSARLAPERLAPARTALHDAVCEAATTRQGAEARAGLLALESDLGRWLALESAEGPGFEPRELEWSFGGTDDEHGPLDLGGLRVSGRVDRVDVGPGGEALVRDYKASRGYPRAKWAAEGRMQAALYAVAARELLGLDPAGALYQPLRGPDLRPRGAARAGAAAAGLVANDVVQPAEWDRVLADMTEQARDAAARLRAGEIVPCPERCTTRGCAYPAICRAPGSEPPPEDEA